MIRFAAACALVLATLAAAPAAAQQDYDSRRRGSVQFQAQQYRPNIDAGLPTNPYEDVFGGGRTWGFRGLASRALYVGGAGALELGLGAAYFRDRGKGQAMEGGDSPDNTYLNVLPATLSLTYRLDVLERRWHIPLMAYGRASLERFHWWVTDGNGNRSESGATNGYSFTGGAGFLLDVFDRGSARDLDEDYGINDTWVTFEVTKSYVDDFGSSQSWDLSDEDLTLGVGLVFVF